MTPASYLHHRRKKRNYFISELPELWNSLPLLLQVGRLFFSLEKVLTAVFCLIHSFSVTVRTLSVFHFRQLFLHTLKILVLETSCFSPVSLIQVFASKHKVTSSLPLDVHKTSTAIFFSRLAEIFRPGNMVQSSTISCSA